MTAKHELPEKYTEVEWWARLLLKRIEVLREAYQDDIYRADFDIVHSAERAGVVRTSLDLSRALATMRKRGT